MKYTDYRRQIEKDPEYHTGKTALKIYFALGDAVLRARIKHGWSQAELAEKVGTKQANISRIEAGIANPTLSLIQKLTQVLQLDVLFTPTISMIYTTPVFYEPEHSFADIESSFLLE